MKPSATETFFRRTPALGVIAIAVIGSVQAAMAAGGPVCIRNGTDDAHYFVAEASDGTRAAGVLAPGAQLCSAAAKETAKSRAMVAAFQDVEAIEGCSRLAVDGETVTLKAYADFDRCAWSTTTGPGSE